MFRLQNERSASPRDTFVNFEDCAKIECADHTSILAATIYADESVAVTVERMTDGVTKYALVFHILHTADRFVTGKEQLERKAVVSLESEPLCVQIYVQTSEVVALVASSDGQLSSYKIEGQTDIRKLGQREMRSTLGSPGICDSMAILQSGLERRDETCAFADSETATCTQSYWSPSMMDPLEKIT